MRIEVRVDIEMTRRPRRKSLSEINLGVSDSVSLSEEMLTTEEVFTAHIYTPLGSAGGDHHGEGPTAAQALVNAALHWERYSR